MLKEKKKIPSLVYETTQVLKKACKFGTSKNSDKHNAKNNKLKYDTYTKNNIYSKKEYKCMKKTCVAFVKFCRSNYKVRFLNQIKSYMFTEFIKRGHYKTEIKYNSRTAATYFAEVKKLENIYNAKNNTNIKFCDKDYKKFITEENKKKIQMPREVHDKIIKRCYETNYENGLAFDLARAAGLRVSEITNLRKKDFHFNKNGKFHGIKIFRSKGGRTRYIESKSFSEKQIKVINSVYNYFNNKITDGERLFKSKSDSYIQSFRRARNFVTNYNEKYEFCGVHSMRKEFANDYYDRETKEKGRDELEVKQNLTKILGHNRTEVLNSYLR